jgi:nucleotide-binding universal stress UspA family protein
MDFTHLLVPLDGSELAAAALPIARVVALSTRAELTLATVLAADREAVLATARGTPGVCQVKDRLTVERTGA